MSDHKQITQLTELVTSADNDEIVIFDVSEVGSVKTKKQTKANFLKEIQAQVDAGGSEAIDAHIADYNNPHSVTKAQVGLGNADNTSDANKPVSIATQSALDALTGLINNVDADLGTHIGDTNNPHNVTKSQVGLGSVTNDAQVKRTEMGTANGVATLGGDGKVPTSQLPALALTDVYVVASQVAQLALTAQEGDVAIRSDLNKSYIHNGGSAGTMADWSELLTPTDNVLSVNGQTGIVSLTTSNIAEGSNLYFTDERAQDAIGAMIDGTLVYTDATPRLQRASLTGAITASAGSNTTALGSFTKAELNSAVSNGDVLYVGDITQYTDEMAQDAVGVLVGNSTGSLRYNDSSAILDINPYNENTFYAKQAIIFDSSVSIDTTAFNVFYGRNISVSVANEEYGFSSLYSGVNDEYQTTGTIDDAIIQKSGFEVGMFRSNDSTVNWIDGYEDFKGYTSYLQYSGAFQGIKHDVNMVGHDITILNSVNFSNEGTHVHQMFGNRIKVNSVGTTAIDSFVTRRAYGEYIEVGIANGGDVNEAYGIYIKDVYSDDVAYAIYSETTAHSHFAGDIEVPDEAYDATAWNGNMEVPTKNAIRDKIESMGGGSSWVAVPASPTATGTQGQISGDATYFYECIATNTWKRVAWDITWVSGDYLLMQNGDRQVFQNGDGVKLQSSI